MGAGGASEAAPFQSTSFKAILSTRRYQGAKSAAARWAGPLDSRGRLSHMSSVVRGVVETPCGAGSSVGVHEVFRLLRVMRFAHRSTSLKMTMV